MIKHYLYEKLKKKEEKNNNISTEKACEKKLKNIRKYKVT